MQAVEAVRVCACHGVICALRGRDDSVRCARTGRELEWPRWRVEERGPEPRTVRSRIADNPNRVKWCVGPCGRPLKVTQFHANGDGYPQAECKACHRDVVRKYHRKRYRRDRAFRERSKARSVASYWRDPEKKRAKQRARYEARKLRGAAA
jgi:hypothetical protein